MTARRVACRWCGRSIALTPNGRLWAHGRPSCGGSGQTPAPRYRAAYIPEVSLLRRFWGGRLIRTVPVAGDLL